MVSAQQSKLKWCSVSEVYTYYCVTARVLLAEEVKIRVQLLLSCQISFHYVKSEHSDHVTPLLFKVHDDVMERDLQTQQMCTHS